MAAFTNTLKTDGILAIVRDELLPPSPPIFPKATCTIEGRIVTLTIPAGEEGSKPAVLSFEIRINDIVKEWKDPRDFQDIDATRDEEKIVRIYVLFREYEQMTHTDVILLQQRITAAIEKTLPAAQNHTDEPDIPIRQIESLFRLERHVKEKTASQNIVLCIGESGAGKSTATNYACGCEMKSVDPILFGKPPGTPNIVIAKNSQARIGHTLNSETSVPNILIPAAGNNFIYIDCPGFGDSRGHLMEICNALSILDAIEGAKTIKACLLFLPYSQLNSKVTSSAQAFKYFQLLLKNFDQTNLKNFKFVITQCPPGAQIHATIPRLLARILRTIIEEPTTDLLLRTFCEQMFTLQAFARFTICDPLLGDKGKSFNAEVAGCEAIQIAENAIRPSFGYPISSGALRNILVIQNAIAPMVQEELIAYQEQIYQSWKKRIDQAAFISDIKEIGCRLSELYQLSLREYRFLETIARATYTEEDCEARRSLSQCLKYWNRLQVLQPMDGEEDINSQLQGSWELISSKIHELCSLADKKHKLLILKKIRVALKNFLESYQVQGELTKYRSGLGELSNAAELLNKLQEFEDFIPHLEELDAILKQEIEGDQPTFKTLREIIRSHILSPIEISGRGTEALCITSRINKIALSQAFQDLGEAEMGAEGELKEITFKLQTEKKKKILYFDKDLLGRAFKNKYIMILADHIVVQKQSKINLQFTDYRGGYIQIESSLKGTVTSSGYDLLLSPSENTSTNRIARPWIGMGEP